MQRAAAAATLGAPSPELFVIALAARLAPFLFLALGVADPLAAQSLDSLPAGTRVRVAHRAPPHKVVGTFVRADSISFDVKSDRGGSTMTMSRSELWRLDVSDGQREPGEAFARGATTGALVGVGIGLVAIGLAIRADLQCDCMATLVIVPPSVAFAVVSTLSGGLIGMSNREQWRRVWPPT